MKIAIMQPYVFPYIGYFQLIQAVDVFVFYDDVHFIKKGFINRNSILLNGIKYPFVIPCKSISQNKLIKDVELFFDERSKQKFLKTLKQAYKRAPYYDLIFPLIKDFIVKNTSRTISEFAIESVKLVANYLQINTQWSISSLSYTDSRGLAKEERLIQIAKKVQATSYINTIGGKTLYSKTCFERAGLELHFIESEYIVYPQFCNEFVPWLSIIDVMMFQSKEDIGFLLQNYKIK